MAHSCRGLTKQLAEGCSDTIVLQTFPFSCSTSRLQSQLTNTPLVFVHRNDVVFYHSQATDLPRWHTDGEGRPSSWQRVAAILLSFKLSLSPVPPVVFSHSSQTPPLVFVHRNGVVFYHSQATDSPRWHTVAEGRPSSWQRVAVIRLSIKLFLSSVPAVTRNNRDCTGIV